MPLVYRSVGMYGTIDGEPGDPNSTQLNEWTLSLPSVIEKKTPLPLTVTKVEKSRNQEPGTRKINVPVCLCIARPPSLPPWAVVAYVGILTGELVISQLNHYGIYL